MRLNDTDSSTSEDTTGGDSDEYAEYETTNYEGGTAYEPPTAKERLVTVVANNLLEGGFYLDDEEELGAVRRHLDEVLDVDAEFPLKLARYARHEMGLRTIPTVLLVEVAHDDRAKHHVRRYAPDVIGRPDEMCKALAYHNELMPPEGERTTPPMPLRKGLSDAFFTFDEYQLSKWQRRNHDVGLVDVMNACHPDPTCEAAREGPANYERVFAQLAKGDLDDHRDVDRLDTPDTRQSVLDSASATVDVPDTTDTITTTERKAQASAGPIDLTLIVTDEDATAAVTRDGESARGVDVVFHLQTNGGDEEANVESVTRTTDDDGVATVEFVGDRTGDYRVVAKEEAMTAAERWRYALAEDKLPLQARVRNVVDMLEAGLDGEEILGDAGMDWVENSRLYPFRYWQAYDAMVDADLPADVRTHNRPDTPDVYDEYAAEWLGDAIDHAARSLPDDLGGTLVAVDGSGSMDDRVANRSDLMRYDIAALFGAVLAKKGAEVVVFSNDVHPVRVHHDDPTVTVKDKITHEMPFGGTDAHEVLDDLRERDEDGYDRVVYVTDEQSWNSSWHSNRNVRDAWDDYRSEVSTETELYIMNIADYGDLMLPDGYPGVYRISGWTERVLDHIEHSGTDVVAEIDREWGLEGNQSADASS